MCIIPRRKEADTLESRLSVKTGHTINAVHWRESKGRIFIVVVARRGTCSTDRVIHNIAKTIDDTAEGWQEFEDHCLRNIP